MYASLTSRTESGGMGPSCLRTKYTTLPLAVDENSKVGTKAPALFVDMTSILTFSSAKKSATIICKSKSYYYNNYDDDKYISNKIHIKFSFFNCYH